MTGRSTRTRNSGSVSAVSTRPRVGSRYSYNSNSRQSSSTAAEDNNGERSWGKLKQFTGKRLWCRLVVSFTIITVTGVTCIIVGAVFLDKARQIHDEDDITLPLIWCIIGMVCGGLLIVCSLILGKIILSSKLKAGQPSRSNQVHESPTHNTVTFIPSRRRTQSGTLASGHLDLGQPPPYESSGGGSSQQVLPPTAVFIISQGDVNLAVPAVVEDHLSPPKYEHLNMVEPPNYSKNDPLKLPKYDELLNNALHNSNGQVSPEDVEREESVCEIDRRQSTGGVARHDAMSRDNEIDRCQSSGGVARHDGMSGGGVENEAFDGVSLEEVVMPAQHMGSSEDMEAGGEGGGACANEVQVLGGNVSVSAGTNNNVMI